MHTYNVDLEKLFVYSIAIKANSKEEAQIQAEQAVMDKEPNKLQIKAKVVKIKSHEDEED